MTMSTSQGAGSDRPFTIVLGDGLDEEVLSPQVRHLDSRASVGEREIERLFGRGRGFGQGPLPAFLQLALAEQKAGGRVGVVLLGRSHEPSDEDHGSTAKRFAPPLDEIALETRVIGCPPGRIPWDALRQAVLEQTGADPGHAANGGAGLRFLVVGCHTEERILALAVFLRRVFQCDEVAVSSHLVGSATQEAHLAVLRHTLPGLGTPSIISFWTGSSDEGSRRPATRANERSHVVSISIYWGCCQLPRN